MVSLLISFSTWAHQPLRLDTGDAILRGIRYTNAAGTPNSGPKIMFTHGLSANYHEYAALMRILSEAGYDCYAFNFRGHGNHSERSVVKNYREGDYSFDKMKAIDFPAMVRFIKGSSPDKLRVIGHSMGGMVPRAALIDGHVQAGEFESLVLLASPAHFENNSSVADFTGANYLAEISLNTGSGEEPYDLINTLVNIDLMGVLFNWHNPVFWAIKGMLLPLNLMELQGVVESRNFSEGDGPHSAMTQNPPKDIYRSFSAFRAPRYDYKYKDQPVHVPILHVVASLDQLAPWRTIAVSAKAQSEAAGYWLVKVDGVSHVDLVAFEVVKKYKSTLLNFLKDRASLGPSGRMIEFQTGGACADLLY